VSSEVWYPAIPQSRPANDLNGRRSMKCLLGNERTRVSVFSDGGILGGHAIDTLVDIDIRNRKGDRLIDEAR
jgi:hypothetical protein